MTEAQRKGTVNELLAAQYFIRKNCVVSKPLNDFSDYDLIVDTGVNVLRVQVKTVSYSNSKRRYVAKLYNAHRKKDGTWDQKTYDENSCDMIACVCQDEKLIYLVPIKLLAGRTGVTFYPTGKPKGKNYEAYRHELYD